MIKPFDTLKTGKAKAANAPSVDGEEHTDAEDATPLQSPTQRRQIGSNDALPFNLPDHLTDRWREISDFAARESVEKAERAAQDDRFIISCDQNTAAPSTRSAFDGHEEDVHLKFPPALYGKRTNKPLIDAEDEEEEEDDPFEQEPPIQQSKTEPENAVPSDIPPPLSGMWRFYSDQLARDYVQHADQVTGTPSCEVAPAVLETTLSSEEASDDERSVHALPDQSRCKNEKDQELSSLLTFLFQDTFSETRGSSLPTNKSAPAYLDPDLVRRAHSNSDEILEPFELPKVVHVASVESIEDALEQLDIGGTPKFVEKGKVEVSPGKFVRVHGERHTRSAIEKGQSRIVKCGSCRKRFQVDRKAKQFYCPSCKSVTELKVRRKKEPKELYNSM
jgi:LSD1 subclass zinc finger protein